MRHIVLLCLLLSACGETTPETGACELLEDFGDCPLCADGTVTCSFEETSVTEPSCMGCQAKVVLLYRLCENGTTATAEEINAEMICEPENTE